MKQERMGYVHVSSFSNTDLQSGLFAFADHKRYCPGPAHPSRTEGNNSLTGPISVTLTQFSAL